MEDNLNLFLQMEDDILVNWKTKSIVMQMEETLHYWGIWKTT